MRKMILLAAAALSIANTAQAFDGDENEALVSTFFPTVISQLSSSGCFYAGCKVIVEAQEDLSYFVASGGAVRTVGLEKAVSWARSNFDFSAANDLEVAQTLLGASAQAQ